jgi:hypothetical protein
VDDVTRAVVSPYLDLERRANARSTRVSAAAGEPEMGAPVIEQPPPPPGDDPPLPEAPLLDVPLLDVPLLDVPLLDAPLLEDAPPPPSGVEPPPSVPPSTGPPHMGPVSGVHVPSALAPLAAVHAWQGPGHAAEQQTASAQKPEAHCAAAAQGAPSASGDAVP